MTRLNFCAVALLALLFFVSPQSFAQTVDRARLESEIDSLKAQIDERAKQLLAVAPEDQIAYAEFLQQRDTGLIRLLPREKFDGVSIMRGGGAYYSFTRLTHEYGYGSDIALEQDYFSSGFAGLDFGMLVNLGNVPLENVALENLEPKFLTTYTPPVAEKEIRRQQMQLGEGIKTDGLTYRHRVPVVANSTYLLRSVEYHSENGKGRDVLVVFRVVRKESDGSVVLLWNMLKRFPPPTWTRDAASR